MVPVFLKLFMSIVFENIENIIFVFFENSCSFNLVFFVFSVLNYFLCFSE